MDSSTTASSSLRAAAAEVEEELGFSTSKISWVFCDLKLPTKCYTMHWIKSPTCTPLLSFLCLWIAIPLLVELSLSYWAPGYAITHAHGGYCPEAEQVQREKRRERWRERERAKRIPQTSWAQSVQNLAHTHCQKTEKTLSLLTISLSVSSVPRRVCVCVHSQEILVNYQCTRNVTISFLLCASLKLRSQFFLPVSSKKKLSKTIKNISFFLSPPSRSQSPRSKALELFSRTGACVCSPCGAACDRSSSSSSRRFFISVSRSPSRRYYTRKAYNKSKINEDFVPRLFTRDEDSVNIRCFLLDRILSTPPPKVSNLQYMKIMHMYVPEM